MRRPVTIARWLAFPLVLAAVLLSAPLALAQEPPKLTARVTDQTGVLSGQESRIGAAIDDLASRANVDLWVLFVDTTGGTTAPDYATETFNVNGFGGNDIVLVVAVNDHRYGWHELNASGLSTDRLNALCSKTLDPNFRAGNYADGIVAFAGNLADVVTGGPVATPYVPDKTPVFPVTPGGSTDTPAPDLGGVFLFLGVLGAIFVVLAVAWGIRAMQLARQPAEERDRLTGELARQANKLLVDTDDAMAEARQELGFAQAEFTETDTLPFADAISKAEENMKEAFALRQKLDDSVPEDTGVRTQMYRDVIGHCQAAQAAVDSQVQRIRAIRELEKNAPQALEALGATIEALKGRLPEVKAALATLSRYSPTASAAVRGNPEEADKRGAFAEAQRKKGLAALAKTPPNSRDAASAARAAQEAVAQANKLLDAVVALAATLEEARGKMTGELNQADADVTAAKSVAGEAKADQVVMSQLEQAEAQLDVARSQVNADKPDPIVALKAAQTAHATADAVLANVRRMAEQRARAKAAFQSTRQMAENSIATADAYLNARRTGISQTPRTRLSEAQRHLARALTLAPNDVEEAAAEARQADSLADEALGLARQEFEGLPYVGGFGAGGAGAGGGIAGTSGSGGSAAGGMLGAFLDALFSSSGGSGGDSGFGHSSWGSSGGWSSGSSSSSSSSSSGHSGGSSFGGFGGGHSSGGGSSSGGGHSGGGGW